MPLLKIDFINDAYSQLRISGITVDPSPDDLQLALGRLEDLAAEFRSRNIDGGYFFEDQPDPNSVVGVPRQYKQAYVTALAVRLIPDFNKQVPNALQMAANAAVENLAANEVNVRQMVYPTRQPIGSGNRWLQAGIRRYYSGDERAPAEDTTHQMVKGDINNYRESFAAYLDNGEIIQSFTITADSGLSILSSSNTDDAVNYQIQATGPGPQKVIIVMTTDLGRVQNRLVWFSVREYALS